MPDQLPLTRNDLEFLPIPRDTQPIILIRDHLGLVEAGKAIAPHLYQFLTLLDGTKTVRDLQAELMRQRGGVLVSADEVGRLLAKLDEAFLLNSERYQKAKNQIVAQFTDSPRRSCSHCGRSYPGTPSELKNYLDQILAIRTAAMPPQGNLLALVAPHIDLAAGARVYASAYQMLRFTHPSRVVLMGTGHHVGEALFCLTDKDFETPLGVVKNEPGLVRELRQVGGEFIATNDFAHRSEHSIEFQLLFLQHLLGPQTFTILPILCGSFRASLSAYSREALRGGAGAFLQKLGQFVNEETLVVAGIDLSHVGLKFGHAMPAAYLERQSKAHDTALLNYLTQLDVEKFWAESARVEDRFHVCGFSTLASLLELLPPCQGEVLDYEIRHEDVTRSAVSFAAVVFTSSAG
ncbi:MAG: AmmeMemoRadiSam system protein B [Desulfobacterales bacterium]|nr:MAG: AmmeMemoRadiSam system protein B [Desulfobacterales bacterium]